MHRPTMFATALLAALLLRSAPGVADAPSPRLMFSGFGTLGHAVLDEPGAEYRSGGNGDGADEDGSFELDTRLGLQLDVEATPVLSGTVQGLARENEDGEPGGELEWAFLRWSLGDSAMLRVGRLALPLFAASDFREVGYANTLVRPPEDVYVQVPLRRYDGAELAANAEIGETLLGLQLGVGRSRGIVNAGLEAEADDAAAIALSAERGPFKLRLSHMAGRLLLEDDGQIARLRDGVERAEPLVPSLAGVTDDLSGERESMTFDAIGLALDLHPVFAEAEYTRRRVGSWSFDADSWYAMLGTRLGSFTPYAFVSAFRDISASREIELPDLTILDELRSGLDAFYESRDQETAGLGLRWDVAPRLALKFQAERISRRDRGVSFVAERNADEFENRTDDGRDVTLYALTLDFIF